MQIKTLVITVINHYSDEDISNYINEGLIENHITSDNLIDIKFSCDDSHINVLIIYKITEEKQ